MLESARFMRHHIMLSASQEIAFFHRLKIYITFDFVHFFMKWKHCMLPWSLSFTLSYQCLFMVQL